LKDVVKKICEEKLQKATGLENIIYLKDERVWTCIYKRKSILVFISVFLYSVS